MANVYHSLVSNNLATTTDLNIYSINTNLATININPSSVGATYTTNIGILGPNNNSSSPSSTTIIGRNNSTAGTIPNTSIYLSENQSSSLLSYTFTSIGQNSSTAAGSKTTSEIVQQTSIAGNTIVRIGSIVNFGTTDIKIGSLYVTSFNVSGSTTTNIGMIDSSTIGKTISGTTVSIIGQLKQTQTAASTTNYLGYATGISARPTIVGTINNYIGYVDQYVSGVIVNNNISNIETGSNGIINTNIGTSSGLGTNNITMGNNNSGTNNLIIQSPITQYKTSNSERMIFLQTGSPKRVIIFNPISKTILSNTITILPSGFMESDFNGVNLYISNNTAGIFYVINLLTYTISSTISITNSYIFTVLANATFAYIKSGNSTIVVLNLNTNTIVTTIDVSTSNVQTLVSSPDSSKVYGISSGNYPILIISTITNTIIANIITGVATGIVAKMSPDALKIYCDSGNTIKVVSTASNTIISSISLGSNATQIIVSPDSNTIYVYSANAASIYVINALTYVIITTITSVIVSSKIGISKDGTKLYVSGNTGNVNIYSTTTYTLIDSYLVADVSFVFEKFITSIQASESSAIRMYDGANLNYVGIKAPNTGLTSYTITLPPTLPFRNSQALVISTDGIGSWSDVILNNGNTLNNALTIGTLDGFSLNLMTASINQISIGTDNIIRLSTSTSGIRTINTTSTELALVQTGDGVGGSKFRIINRSIGSGALIQNLGNNYTDVAFQTPTTIAALTDFVIRYSNSTVFGLNTSEFQFGPPITSGTPFMRIGNSTVVISSVLNFNNQPNAKIIALNDSGSITAPNSRHDYTGFGLDTSNNNNILRYQIPLNTSSYAHTFYSANTSQQLYQNTIIPGYHYNTAEQYELGTEIQFTISGQIKALRMYIVPGATIPTGGYTIKLWLPTGIVASVNVPTTSPYGWNTINLATPYTIIQNTSYIVSYGTLFQHYTQFSNIPQTNIYYQKDPNSVNMSIINILYASGNNINLFNTRNISTTDNFYVDAVFYPTSITNSTALMSINGAGTISIPKDGLLNLACDMRVNNMVIRNVAVVLPVSPSTNNCIDFVSWTFTNGTANLDVMITVPMGPTFSSTKRYLLTISSNMTNGSWHAPYPFTRAGVSSISSGDFELEVNVSGNICKLRLKRSSGTVAATAYVTVLQNGITSDTYTVLPPLRYKSLVATTRLISACTGSYVNTFNANTINSTSLTTPNNIICNGSAYSAIINTNQTYILNGGIQFYRPDNNYSLNLRQSPSLSSSYTLYLPATIGSNGQALITNNAGNTSWASVPQTPNTYFGDGSDGDLVVNGGTNYVLTRDMYFNNVTISSNTFPPANVDTRGSWRLFVKNTLTIGGMYSYINAGNGPEVAQSTRGGQAGFGINTGNGSIRNLAGTNATTNGLSVTNSLGGNGGASTVYSGGTATAPTATEGGINATSVISNALNMRTLSGVAYNGGAGGGGNGSSGGGAGGGLLFVFAKTITISSGAAASAVFSAMGGWSANGGGGGGGAVVIATNTNIAALYNLSTIISVRGGYSFNTDTTAASGNYFIVSV